MIVCRRDERELLRRERLRLVEDRVGDGELADVVQLGGELDLAQRVVVETEAAAEVDD